MLDEGFSHGCMRYLLDHQAATIHLKFAELLKALPKDPVDFELPSAARLAILVCSADMQEREFFEAYIKNRGRDFKVFEDESLAVSWLSRPKPGILDFPSLGT